MVLPLCDPESLLIKEGLLLHYYFIDEEAENEGVSNLPEEVAQFINARGRI